MDELLLQLSRWIAPYNRQLALAVVATLLVIFGDGINRRVRKLVRNQWFIVRVIVFVALCTFGYGMLTVLLVPQVAMWMKMLPANWYGVSVVVGFLALGWLAERYHRKG